MNGTIRRLLGRSVQLAVMATPSTTVAEAIAEARQRPGSAAAWIADTSRTATPRMPAPALGY